MKIMRAYLLTFLALPLIGCYIMYFSNDTIQGYDVTPEILTKYTIHLFIIASFVYYFTRNKKKNIVDVQLSVEYAKKILKRTRLMLFLVLAMITYFSAIPIFIKGLDRGIVRANLGLMGPLYTFSVLYLLVSSVAISGLLYYYIKEKKEIKSIVIMNFAIALLSAFFTGYKSTVVTLIIPGIAFMLYNRTILKFIPYSLVGIFLITYSTMKVRGISLSLAWLFLRYRIFNLTNFGTLGVYYEMGKGAEIEDVFFQFMSIFGKKITSIVTGISPHSPKFFKMSLSDNISYLIYADTQAVLDGTVNLTVANFGEAVFFFGRDYYFLFSIFTGIIIGKTLSSINKALNVGNIEKVILMGTFFFVIIIPWINSSGVYSLFSLPTIVYFGLLYIYVKFLMGRIVFR